MTEELKGQNMSSEDEEWDATKGLERMRQLFRQMDSSDRNRLVIMPAPCMPFPLRVDVSWTVEKTSIPTPQKQGTPNDGYRCETCGESMALCECDEDAS